jgi:hypothetical protein
VEVSQQCSCSVIVVVLIEKSNMFFEKLDPKFVCLRSKNNERNFVEEKNIHLERKKKLLKTKKNFVEISRTFSSSRYAGSSNQPLDFNLKFEKKKKKKFEKTFIRDLLQRERESSLISFFSFSRFKTYCYILTFLFVYECSLFWSTSISLCISETFSEMALLVLL